MSQSQPCPPAPHRRADSLRNGFVGWAVASALGLLLLGCQPNAEIHKYQIPKELAKAAPAPAAALAPDAENLPAGRMLAAIVLRPGKAWFFKLSALLPAASAHVEEFEKLIASLRFDDASSPRWKTPAGWSEEGATGMRLATLKSPADTPAAEVSITTLPFSGGDDAAADKKYLLFNINRWRGQMLAEPIELDQLAAETKQVDLHGATATVVDIIGKLAPPGMGAGSMAPGNGGPPGMAARPLPPMAAGGDLAAKTESLAEPGRMLAAIVLRPGEGWFFKLAGPGGAVSRHEPEFQKFIASLHFDDKGLPEWQAPSEWTSGPTNAMRYATLALPGDPPLELTISKLPYAADDPLDYELKNVNRWRGQLQLPPTTREQLSADLQHVALADGEALVVDLSSKPTTAAAAGSKSESSPAPGADHGN